MRKPSSATVLATVALFVALGGAGMAATGGNFILGQSNSADKTTALTAPVVGGKALQLTNTDTTNAGSTALGITVARNHAPFTVNTGVKVTNLNADRLDGADSSSFLPRAGKAADADKLDGLSSESFTQGGGRLYSAHRENVPPSTSPATLLDIPGAIKLEYQCDTDTPGPYITIDAGNLTGSFEFEGGSYQSSGRLQSGIGLGTANDMFIHIFGSRPFNRMTFEPAVLVEVRVEAEYMPATDTCSLRAVGEAFG